MKKNWLEWIIFSISSTLILLVLATLARDALAEKKLVPAVTVKLGEPIQNGTQYLLPVEVENQADETAEGLKIEVKLSASGEEETAEIDFLFLPRRSKRQGWVVFSSDPREAEKLEAKPVGYEKP